MPQFTKPQTESLSVESSSYKKGSWLAATSALQLTPRETEIVQLLSQGFSSQEIAEQLIVSEHTICTHRKHIMKKTQAKNTVHLVALMLKSGLI